VKQTTSLFFTFQKTKYVWEGEERKQFAALEYPVEKTFKEYMEWKGHSTEEQLSHAQQTYGNNRWPSCG